jgi:hypothetical protein
MQPTHERETATLPKLEQRSVTAAGSGGESDQAGIIMARQRYAGPRRKVEEELAAVAEAAENLQMRDKFGDEPSGPNEDDLVR